MLGIMRKYKESIVIKVVFGIIVLSFIGTIFLVWGRGEKGVTPSSYAVKVDGKQISIEDFSRSYKRLRDIYQQIYGANYNPDMEKKLNLKQTVIDNLVKTALARKEAGSMGIKVSKDELVAAISAEPAFQKDGAFNFDIYQQTLKANRLTTNAFEDAKREELVVSKVFKTVKDKVKVSDEQALQEYKKQNDKINLEYVAFSPASVKNEVKVTEQEINEYYQKHQNDLKAPEQISVAYALVDPAKAAGTVSISEDEAMKFYQKNIDRYQDKGAILPYEQVKSKVREDALKNKAATVAYEKAAQAVNKQSKSGDVKAAAQELGSAVTTTPLFTAAQPPAALAAEPDLVKRVFVLKDGELGAPIETKKGIYLVKLAQRKPAATPPLAAIKAQVESRAKDEKAVALASRKAEEAVAALTAKSPVSGLKETGLFKYSANGTIPAIGSSPELADVAFALTAAAPVAKKPVKVGDTWYAVRLKTRVDARQDEFQRTKEQLKASLLPKKQEEALEKWLADLKAKAKIEINPGLKDL